MQVGDIGIKDAGGLAELLLQHALVEGDAERTANAQLHARLVFGRVLGIGLMFHEEIGLILVELQACRLQEIQIELVYLLCLEHIGPAVRIIMPLGILALSIHVATIAYETVERCLDLSVEIGFLVFVLLNVNHQLVHADGPSTHFTGTKVEDLAQAELHRHAGSIEEHALCLQLQPAALVLGILHRATANGDHLRHEHAQVLHVESLPLLVGSRSRRHAGLHAVVAVRQFAHALAVGALRVVEDDGFAGREGPSWQVFGLELVHAHIGIPVVPVANLRYEIHHGVVLSHGATLVNLHQSGNLHVDIDLQDFQFIGFPGDEAAVSGLKHIARCLEGHLKRRFRINDRKVAQQGQCASLGQHALGTDAESRRAQQQDVVLQIVAARQGELADHVHRGIRGGELHLRDLYVNRTLVDALWNLQGQMQV